MLLFRAGVGRGGAHTAWLPDITGSRRHGGPRKPPLLGVQEVSSLVGGGKREHSRPLASGWGGGEHLLELRSALQHGCSCVHMHQELLIRKVVARL